MSLVTWWRARPWMVRRAARHLQLRQIHELVSVHAEQLMRLDGRFAKLEDFMAWSKQDIERINAATSRISAVLAAVVKERDDLRAGRDAEQTVSSAQAATVLAQLDLIGADGNNPVPDPTVPDEVNVQPGPDVTPVVNVPAELPETPADPVPTSEVSPPVQPEAPSQPEVVAPAEQPATPAQPEAPTSLGDGQVVFDEPAAPATGTPDGSSPEAPPAPLGDGQTQV